MVVGDARRDEEVLDRCGFEVGLNTITLTFIRIEERDGVIEAADNRQLLVIERVSEDADISMVFVMRRGAFFLFFALLVLFVFLRDFACVHENHGFFCA